MGAFVWSYGESSMREFLSFSASGARRVRSEARLDATAGRGAEPTDGVGRRSTRRSSRAAVTPGLTFTAALTFERSRSPAKLHSVPPSRLPPSRAEGGVAVQIQADSRRRSCCGRRGAGARRPGSCRWHRRCRPAAVRCRVVGDGGVDDVQAGIGVEVQAAPVESEVAGQGRVSRSPSPRRCGGDRPAPVARLPENVEPATSVLSARSANPPPSAPTVLDCSIAGQRQPCQVDHPAAGEDPAAARRRRVVTDGRVRDRDRTVGVDGETAALAGGDVGGEGRVGHRDRTAAVDASPPPPPSSPATLAENVEASTSTGPSERVRLRRRQSRCWRRSSHR